jgi:iron complex transport system ATP-binding protein
MTGTAVSTEGLTVAANGRRLLDEVTLGVGVGELIGIVGPNGAGKTTLLRAIAGDLAVASGSACLMGVDVESATLRRLARIRAYVAPQSSSDVAFRVGQVVAMGRHPFRTDETDSRAEDEIVANAMHRVDVAHLADREMRTLSSGEQQRVALARAIAQETPVILLDEPTSALDIGHKEMVMALLRQLAAAGVAIVAVFHDLNLGAVHADRVVLLDKGRAEAIGSPREVFTASRLSAAYREPMAVIDHPFRDCPLILITGARDP